MVSYLEDLVEEYLAHLGELKALLISFERCGQVPIFSKQNMLPFSFTYE